MYDPTFGPSSISRQIRKSDFNFVPDLTKESVRREYINRAVMLGADGFASTKIERSLLGGRTVYRLTDYAAELVLRKAAQNLRRISGARQRSRTEVIRRLQLLCEEGVPFTLAKFDVRQFYESINQNALAQLIERRFSTSIATRRVLQNFLKLCIAHKISGLPRGLAISAVLSEFYMQDFDNYIQRQLNTYFYARYVDDIIAVLPPTKCSKLIRRQVQKTMPQGLVLNNQKTEVMSFSGSAKSNPTTENCFNYLGFSFQVSQVDKNGNQPSFRHVRLDIAKSKIQKRKTRVAQSFVRYLADENFDDLIDRIKLLTCNYRFYDHKHSRERFAGNFHSYGMITQSSKALVELDRFLHAMILSKTGKICGKLSSKLTNQQKKQLLRLSFERGFNNRIHFSFPPERLRALVECWKYA